MRKFLAILCSVVMVFSSIGVMAATDPYEFDGDTNENPWADLFTTTAPEVVETTTPAPEESSSEEEEPIETTTVEETSAIVDRDDNVALNKSATASSELSSAMEAVDGNENSRWESEHGVDPQWLQVYLEGTYLIDACLINWETAAAETYEVQVSMDGEDWKPVSSVSSGTSGDTRYLAWEPVEAKYVKVVGTSRTTQYGYSIYELEVYGSLIEADETTTEAPVVVAPNAPVGFTWAGNDVYPHYFAWAPVDGAVSYNLYINDVLVGTSEIQNYNIDASNFTESGEYIIAVTAVGETGLESEKTTYTYKVEVEVETTTEEPEESSSEEPSEEPSVEETTTEYVNPITIVSQPQDVSSYVDKFVSFTVEAVGNGLTYQWQVSSSGGERWANTALTGNKTAKLTLSVMETYDGRMYRCIITDSDGNTITTEPATLTVIEQVIEIVSQPKDIGVEESGKATFTVEATGKGLTYQWQVSSSGGERWANTALAGNKTATLSFVALANYDGRMYRCVITDSVGNTVTTDVAVLSIVIPELAIITQPQDFTIEEGGTASFTVEATGSKIKYQWQVSSSGGERWANTSLTGNKTATLSFPALANYDGRMYRCVITDSYGETITTDAATLNIDTPELTIVTQPADVAVEVGENVVISVEATGSGLKYQWQVSSSGGERWANTTIVGYNTSALTFTAPANYDGRMYRCIITDVVGNTVTTDAMTLSVGREELVLVSQPQNVVVSAGEIATFTVEATGVDLTYQWQVSSSGGERWANTTLVGYNTDTLSFATPANYNGRMYRCIITDKYGSTITTDAATITIK